MVRQRWGEAGVFRRLSVVAVLAQAFLITAAFIAIALTWETTSPYSIEGNLIVAALFCIIPLAVSAGTAWAVLTGSLRGRILATALSVLTMLVWLPQGWTGLVIAIVAIATILVVWRHDVVAGATGIRPAQPLE